MTAKLLDFNSAKDSTTLADAVAVTVANSGLSLIYPASSTKYYAAAARTGAFGIRVTGTGVIRGTSAANKRQAERVAIRFTGAGTGGASSTDINLGGQRNDTDDALVFKIRIDTATKLRLTDSADGALGANQKVTITPGAWYELAWVLDQGSSATTGSITAHLYDTDGTTIIGTWASTTANLLGATAKLASGWTLGSVSGDQTITLDVDNVYTDDGQTVEPAQIVAGANVAPTAAYDAPGTSVAAGAQVSSTLTGTDSDGTIVQYEHTIYFDSSGAVTLTGAGAAQCTLTAPAAGGLVILRGRVKDNSGAWSPYVYKEIRVPSSAQTVGPLPIVAEGTGFTRVGTATTDGGALADADNTTYLETNNALSSTVQTLRIRVTPTVTKSGTLAVIFTLRRTGPSCTAAIRLMQGNVNRGSLGSITVTDSWADYELDLSTTQAAAITDWGNLYGEVDGVL